MYSNAPLCLWVGVSCYLIVMGNKCAFVHLMSSLCVSPHLPHLCFILYDCLFKEMFWNKYNSKIYRYHNFQVSFIPRSKLTNITVVSHERVHETLNVILYFRIVLKCKQIEILFFLRFRSLRLRFYNENLHLWYNSSAFISVYLGLNALWFQHVPFSHIATCVFVALLTVWKRKRQFNGTEVSLEEDTICATEIWFFSIILL